VRDSSKFKPIRFHESTAAETLALQKILAMGNQDVAAGKVKSAVEVVERLRAKRVKRRNSLRRPELGR